VHPGSGSAKTLQQGQCFRAVVRSVVHNDKSICKSFNFGTGNANLSIFAVVCIHGANPHKAGDPRKSGGNLLDSEAK
jgi:hypothetical protein